MQLVVTANEIEGNRLVMQSNGIRECEKQASFRVELKRCVPRLPSPKLALPTLPTPALALPELKLPLLELPELATPRLALPELSVPCIVRQIHVIQSRLHMGTSATAMLNTITDMRCLSLLFLEGRHF